MISVVVCSRQPPSWQVHQNHIRQTIGCAYEYIRIDNSDGAGGICAAYNNGAVRATGEIIVFMHEDVFAATPHWGPILKRKFDTDRTVGCVGLAGTQYLLEDNPFWAAAGRPYIHGRVVHEERKQGRLILTVFSIEDGDREVVAADGLFLAVRRPILQTVHFDEETFDQYHFYDLDICMQIRRNYRIIVTTDILVKHLSGGAFDDAWRTYAGRFLKKYSSELPVSCTEIPADRPKHVPFDSCDLTALMSSKAVAHIRGLGAEPCIGSAPSVQNRPPGERLIAVTGMHRSGTSCIAGLLDKCGLSVGPLKELLNHNAPRPDNAKGHFENRDVVLINEAILKAAGGSWFAPPPASSLESVNREIADHVAAFCRSFAGSVIKDPRLCVTLRVWRALCPRLQGAVICFRNPVSVANSLRDRDGLPIGKGLRLWYEYYSRLIDGIEGLPVAIVDYDRLGSHLVADLHLLLKLLKTPMDRDAIVEGTKGFYDRGLDRHSIAGTHAMPEDVEILYDILKGQSVAALRADRASP